MRSGRLAPTGCGHELTECRLLWGVRWSRPPLRAARFALRLDDGAERLVDHALLATGFPGRHFQVSFLASVIMKQVEMVGGFPVLDRGLESSVPGLHFLGKPAAWSFGPLLGFVSGAEFASNELIRSITRSNGSS